MATKKLADRITLHGRNLLRIFRKATDRDPVSLCKRLRRLEAKAAKIGLRLCNGPEYPEDELERDCEKVLAAVNKLLGNRSVPIILNQDPRGYALKIDDAWMREHDAKLHRDWGGYGIIAPDLRQP